MSDTLKLGYRAAPHPDAPPKETTPEEFREAFDAWHQLDLQVRVRPNDQSLAVKATTAMRMFADAWLRL